MIKVLLVSNDEPSCQMLEQGLKQHDYDVVTASQGDKGLTLAITASPDLILFDIDVPVVDGLQAIKFLREISITKPIPVIAIVNRTISRQLLSQAGFDTYVRKPVSLRTLLVRIEVLLDIVTASQAKPDKISLNLSFGVSSIAPETTHEQK